MMRRTTMATSEQYAKGMRLAERVLTGGLRFDHLTGPFRVVERGPFGRTACTYPTVADAVRASAVGTYERPRSTYTVVDAAGELAYEFEPLYREPGTAGEW
jgi:hypothetical protein